MTLWLMPAALAWAANVCLQAGNCSASANAANGVETSNSAQAIFDFNDGVPERVLK
jgi:hypothetical protein